MRNPIFNFQLSTFNAKILRLALPSVVTNITVPLLGLVDTAVVGHMGASEHIAAVAIGTTIFSMTYWLFGFLRMGTTGLVSQAHGAGDEAAIREGLLQGLSIGFLISALLLLLQTPLLHFALWLMQPEAEVARLASDYFRVCIWGAPAMLSTYVLTGWFIGMQDTRTPMRMAILQNLLNIFFTLVFVYGFGLGVRGVALGTVVGLYAGAAFGAHRARREDRGRRESVGEREQRERSGSVWSEASVRSVFSVFSVYIYIFLRTLCLVAVTVFFTSAGSRMGTLTLDANTLLMQFFIVFSYFTDGLANAAEALSGEHVGKKDRAGLLATVGGLFRWGFALAFLFTVVYAAAGPWLLSLLTNQQAVTSFALCYLAWIVAVPLVSVAAFVWDGIYIGMTLTRRMFLSMFLSAIVFFVLWFLLGPRFGNHALWLSFLSYLATRSLMQTALFPRR